MGIFRSLLGICEILGSSNGILEDPIGNFCGPKREIWVQTWEVLVLYRKFLGSLLGVFGNFGSKCGNLRGEFWVPRYDCEQLS